MLWPRKPQVVSGFLLLIITIADMSAEGSISPDNKIGECAVPTAEAGESLVYFGTDKLSHVHEDLARYDHYRVYNVELDTDQHVDIFQKMEQQSDSLTFMGHAREIGQKLTILVAAHKVADFADLLKTYGVKHRILTFNFQEKIDRNIKEVLPADTAASALDWRHFFHLKTIYAWLEYMVDQYPKDLSLIEMGNSTQGVPIKGLKLSRNASNKAIFIESGIHAREWIAPAVATYLINELLTSKEEAVQTLANNYNWIVFPSVNPDGYKYTFEHDRMWRKNRQLFGICRGVDLNRNYPDHWNTTGASGDPCRYDYSGPSEGSEIETKRLTDFLQAHVDKEQIRTYIALHSYSQMIMFPYGYTKKHVSNYDDLQEFGRNAVGRIRELTGRNYTSGSIIETIYPSSGGSMDWAYSKMNIPIAYTFELRGPPDSSDMFILPANEIEPTAQEAFVAIRTIIEGATKKGYFN
ncbi:zinc carboxypeptidase isoform X1 [Anastrepha obliqua]|uniref:zinc carboxypeptidase isoform X1 n=2 Tax=Anastrepha obliqua TaxID=95512 RepID=UPI00240A64D1|nr:zinc carboxypeptidase isoform X1 [Anastrepha obliqua]XP_054739832.1 zinc carboxypeptidase isoform X1 [Anastrepha obliqua]